MTVGALSLSLSVSIVEETDKYRHAMGRNVVTMGSYTMRQIYNYGFQDPRQMAEMHDVLFSRKNYFSEMGTGEHPT